ncbi:MAG: hypothetical protein ACO3CQ_02820 [Candidatus Nanopelagicaceae bacterium]
MSFRWMTPKDLSAAVRAQNILNSRVKRGEIEQPTKYSYVVCGCGEEGCGFISCVKKVGGITK